MLKPLVGCGGIPPRHFVPHQGQGADGERKAEESKKQEPITSERPAHVGHQGLERAGAVGSTLAAAKLAGISQLFRNRWWIINRADRQAEIQPGRHWAPPAFLEEISGFKKEVHR